MATKRKILSIIYWLLLCQVLLVACSSAENHPPLDFEESYVNQQILLSTPAHFNTYKTRDPIYIEIRSVSNSEIVLPNNLNLRIFERKDRNWIEIPELATTRLPAGDTVLSRTKTILNTTYTDPGIPDVTRKYHLRIYVSGDMKTEEGIKEVAAYVDVTLHP